MLDLICYVYVVSIPSVLLLTGYLLIMWPTVDSVMTDADRTAMAGMRLLK